MRSMGSQRIGHDSATEQQQPQLLGPVAGGRGATPVGPVVFSPASLQLRCDGGLVMRGLRNLPPTPKDPEPPTALC